MQDIIIRVTAYYGNPKFIGEIPFRDGVSKDLVIESNKVINDFARLETIIDFGNQGKLSDYSIDRLVNFLEEKYHCKINIDDVIENEDHLSSNDVYEFDIFEPSWDNELNAQNVIDEISLRLNDWVIGYPSGR